MNFYKQNSAAEYLVLSVHFVFLNTTIATQHRENGSLLANEVAWWVKTLAAKADDLSVIPRTHILERENQLLQVVSWLPYAFGTHKPLHSPMAHTCF